MLKSELESIIGFPIEVERTRDGKFIVLYMNFNLSPPPKGDTEEEACSKFLEYWRKHENRIRPVLEDNSDDEGPKGTDRD